MIDLRPYQKYLIHLARESFKRGNKFPLIQLPTGGGKSIVFCWIVSEMVKQNKRCLIITHREEILLQIFKHLRNFEINAGIIKSGYDVVNNPVQIASVQTLAKRLSEYPHSNFDLIISDEHHHAVVNSEWGKICEHFDCRKLGFTATPIRLDGKGLGISKGGFCDDLINGISVRELIDMNFLVKAKVYAPTTIDLTGVKTIAGDFDKKEISYRIDKPNIMGDVIENFKKYGRGKTIIFCTSIKHAQNVADEFSKNGFPAKMISGETKNREEIMNDFRIGKIQILTNCDIIGEGVDIPDVETVIMLRPTKSESLYLQQAGRGLRPCESKKYCVILDHVGNTHRHGHPESDRDWSLNGRVKKKQELSISQCEKCYYVYPSNVICPNCGHQRKIVKQEIKTKSGNLQEIEAKKKHLRMEVGKARTKESLEKIAKERNYKDGWVRKMLEIRGIKNN